MCGENKHGLNNLRCGVSLGGICLKFQAMFKSSSIIKLSLLDTNTGLECWFKHFQTLFFPLHDVSEENKGENDNCHAKLVNYGQNIVDIVFDCNIEFHIDMEAAI